MTIDIDCLTEAELIDLNHRIVARLKLMRAIQAHNQMLEFRIGDRVSFQARYGHAVVGMLTKFNRKTVTVVADTGQQWTVAPSFLRRVVDVKVQASKTVTVQAVQEERRLEATSRETPAPPG